MSEIRKLPEVTRNDVRALVDKVGDGTVSARDLYAVYQEMMSAQGREPVPPRTLGRAMRDAHQRPTIRSVDRKNIRCWVIRKKQLEWLYEDEWS